MTVCQAFETVGDTSRIEAEKYIPVFKKAWEKVDPEGKGMINRYKLAALLVSLPRPLGCLHATKFEAEIMMRHITNHDSTFDYSLPGSTPAISAHNTCAPLAEPSFQEDEKASSHQREACSRVSTPRTTFATIEP